MNCQEPGCPGVIEDGYCNECGVAPAPAASTTSSPRSLRTSGSGTRGTRRSSGRTATRARLGSGLVEVPPTDAPDPETALLVDPHIPEERRACANPQCGAPVGRARDGRPGLTEGYCSRCGWAFSFRPRLTAGELVAGQYAVAGCLAHGGLGWIYLARDRNVSDKWVVLKGLLNNDDPDALAAALAERQFLAEIDHNNIVRIINVVEHGRDGYIVMEYVQGSSLREILERRRVGNGDVPDPLPVEEALAYILELLPAFAYLHRIGLLYCDFKPDNVMRTHDSVKLIDLGGAYRVDQPSPSVYGTRGYQAPEIADRGPSIASDLFTVGRTLAALCCATPGFQQRYEFTLPAPADEAVFRRHDSLYRFLQRATAADPDDRFQSADEMAAQLLGVLREVVATESGRTITASSDLFTPELRPVTGGPDWRGLPMLLVSTDDPSAGFLASLPPVGRAGMDEAVELLASAPEQSVEVRLRHARLLAEAGRGAAAEAVLGLVSDEDPWEWRVAWYRGMVGLQEGHPEQAVAAFDVVYRTVPGELAPKLALGYALELAGDVDRAAAWYDVVGRTDPSYTLAAFGLARCQLAVGDLPGALAAYDRVPPTANAYLPAQTAKATAMLGDGAPRTREYVAATVDVVDGLLAGEERSRLTARLFELALETVRDVGDDPDAPPVLGRPFTDTDLRFGLESSYRALARFASTPSERIALVDRANDARPRTLT